MKAELVLDLVVSDIISEMFLFLILQPEFRNRLDKRKQDRIAAIVILQFFPTILNFASTHSSKSLGITQTAGELPSRKFYLSLFLFFIVLL